MQEPGDKRVDGGALGRTEALIPAFARRRREKLLNVMDELQASGVDCKHCVGTCCTMAANSIQITPLEGYELLRYLLGSDRWTEERVAKLERTVLEARLNVALNLPRNQIFRRTYTCPFFSGGKLGCAVPPELKPYGCLAFNPRSARQREGGTAFPIKLFWKSDSECGLRMRRAHNATCRGLGRWDGRKSRCLPRCSIFGGSRKELGRAERCGAISRNRYWLLPCGHCCLEGHAARRRALWRWHPPSR